MVRTASDKSMQSSSNVASSLTGNSGIRKGSHKRPQLEKEKYGTVESNVSRTPFGQRRPLLSANNKKLKLGKCNPEEQSTSIAATSADNIIVSNDLMLDASTNASPSLSGTLTRRKRATQKSNEGHSGSGSSRSTTGLSVGDDKNSKTKIEEQNNTLTNQFDMVSLDSKSQMTSPIASQALSSGEKKGQFRCVSYQKAKRVRFFRNGDQYYKGVLLAISNERFRSLTVLSEELNRLMGNSPSLPHGVRHIFSSDGALRVNEVDELIEGYAYVCSSVDSIKLLDYEKAKAPVWYFAFPKLNSFMKIGTRHSLAGKRRQDEKDKSLGSFGKDFTKLTTKNRTYRRPTTLLVKQLVKMPTRNDRLSAQNKLDVIKQSIKEIEIIAEVEESGQEIERLPFELAEQMEVVRLLGDGNSAVVVMVQVKETREEKALKIIKPQNIPNLKELIETELTIMSKIDHEFIVRMYEHWFIDDSWYISLELIPEGDLFEALRSARYFDERSSASLIKCLSSALSYLHSQHIVHRDVKMENLLIFYDYSRDFELPYLKLADFGLATEFGEDLLYDLCGTPSYVSVETLSGVGYREKSDLWSCGVITYILLCGFPPFQSPNNDQEELFGQILKAKFFFPSPVWDKISFSARNLICNMLTVNVDERYSAEQVYNNDWVALLGNVTKEFEDIQEFELEDRLARNASAQMPFEDLSDDSDNSEFYYQKHRSFDDISQSSNINKYESPIHRQRERSDSFLITKR